MEDNINEFTCILQFLTDKELTILYNTLLLKDETERRVYIRKNQPIPNGNIYNALSATVLVEDPIYYVNKEIVNRFIS
jgi:hypothetical protein